MSGPVPHTPILVQEVIRLLITDPSGVYVDGTVGFGGHASAILQLLQDDAEYIGLDCDPYALSFTRNRLINSHRNFKLFQRNFRQIPEVIKECGYNQVNGILLDLGMSSYELDTPERGFSHQSDGPLDMRFNSDSGMTAAEYLSSVSERDLVEIIRRYGEERHAKKIARRIVTFIRDGKMKTTFDLKDAVLSVVKGKFAMKSVSRVFQAIRIHINDELSSLSEILENASRLLIPGGRIAVITFHSLEDRMVKQFFREASRTCVCPREFPVCICDTQPEFNVVTRKAIIPSEEEQTNNPRSQSAKLRVAERI